MCNFDHVYYGYVILFSFIVLIVEKKKGKPCKLLYANNYVVIRELNAHLV